MESSYEPHLKIVSNDQIAVYLEYNATNKDRGALVYEKDCITALDKETYFFIGTSDPTVSMDGYIQFNTTLLANITALNGSQYWNKFEDGTKGGYAEICVETYLSFTDSMNGGNMEKVELKNSILNISVSLNPDFTLTTGVKAEREDAERKHVKTDYSKYITAYECNESDLSQKATGIAYNQGEEIAVCVSDESGGIVQVEQFVDLVVSQGGGNDYNFILNTI